MTSACRTIVAEWYVQRIKVQLKAHGAPVRGGRSVSGLPWSGSDAELTAALISEAPERVLTSQPAGWAPHLGRVESLIPAGGPWVQLVASQIHWYASGPTSKGQIEFDAARDAFTEGEDAAGLAVCFAIAGIHALAQGKLSAAAEPLEQSRVLLDDNSVHVEGLLANSAWAEYEAGNLAAAVAIAEQALGLARIRGNGVGEAIAWFHLGFFSVWTGDFNQARAALHASIDSFGGDDQEFEVAMAHCGLGVLFSFYEDFESAEVGFQQALDTAAVKSFGNRWPEAIILTQRAQFTARQTPQRALQDATTAQHILDDLNERWWSILALLATATALHHLERFHAADLTYQEVLRRTVTEGRLVEGARAQVVYAEHLIHQDRFDEACDQLQSALGPLRLSGARYFEARAHVALIACDKSRARSHRAAAHRAMRPERPYQLIWRRGLPLSIRMLNGPHVSQGGVPVQFPTRKAEEALYFLALQPDRTSTAEILAAALWPDASPKQARQRVNTVVWQLKTALGLGSERIQRAHNRIHLDLDDHECDLFQRVPSATWDHPRAQTAHHDHGQRFAPHERLLPAFAESEWINDLQYHLHR